MQERLYLYCQDAEREGRSLKVQIEKRLTLGRSGGNKCRLEHPTVSRYHAVIDLEGEQWVLYNVAADNPILIEIGSEGPELQENEGYPLSDRLCFWLGEVVCKVTREEANSQSFPSRMFRTPTLSFVEEPRVKTSAIEINAGGRGTSVRRQTLDLAEDGSRRTAAAVSDGALGPPERHTLEDLPVADMRPRRPKKPPIPAIVPVTPSSADPREMSGDRPDPAVDSAASFTSTIVLSGQYDESSGATTDYDTLLAANPRLVIVKEGLSEILKLGDRFQMKDGRFQCIVGRDSKRVGPFGVTVNDKSITAVHAKIEFLKNRFYVTDLDSSNKTKIGARMESGFYAVTKPPVVLPPRRPEGLTPETHLIFGLVDALFVVDYDECEFLDPERYEKTVSLLVRKGQLTRQQRKELSKKAKMEMEKHKGALLLRDGQISLLQWLYAYKLADLVMPETPSLVERMLGFIFRY